MNKKISLGATITLMIMAAAVTFSMTMIYYMDVFNGKVYNLKERETMYSKLSELDRIVRANYIDEIDEDALNEALADGYVIGTGDKYARYFTPEEYNRIWWIWKAVSLGLVFLLNRTPVDIYWSMKFMLILRLPW